MNLVQLAGLRRPLTPTTHAIIWYVIEALLGKIENYVLNLTSSFNEEFALNIEHSDGTPHTTIRDSIIVFGPETISLHEFSHFHGGLLRRPDFTFHLVDPEMSLDLIIEKVVKGLCGSQMSSTKENFNHLANNLVAAYIQENAIHVISEDVWIFPLRREFWPLLPSPESRMHESDHLQG